MQTDFSDFDKNSGLSNMVQNVSEHKPRAVKILVIAAVNLTVLFLLLAAAEAVCRLAKFPFKGLRSPSENAIARFDEELGWAYIPNLSKNVPVNRTTIPMHFDRDGIRVPYAGYRFDYSRPSVLFIGCSLVMGHGLSYDDSFVGQFQKSAEKQWQTVNLGVQGYGSDQAMLALKKFIGRFNTKIVVYVYIPNHIRRNGNYDRRMLVPDARFLGTKPLFDLTPDGELYLAKRPVLYENYWNSWLIDALKIYLGSKLGWFPPHPEELTKAIIVEMNRVAEARGARFLLVHWGGQDPRRHDIIEDLATVDVVNVSQNAPPDFGQMIIPNDGHPDARAGRYVCVFLRDCFIRRGWLK